MAQLGHVCCEPLSVSNFARRFSSRVSGGVSGAVQVRCQMNHALASACESKVRSVFFPPGKHVLANLPCHVFSAREFMQHVLKSCFLFGVICRVFCSVLFSSAILPNSNLQGPNQKPHPTQPNPPHTPPHPTPPDHTHAMSFVLLRCLFPLPLARPLLRTRHVTHTFVYPTR